MRIVEIPDDGIVRSPIMNGEDTVGEMRVDLSYLPTLKDVAPVVHARWEEITGGMVMLGNCSSCKIRQPVYGTNHCKNCGAKVSLED